MGESQYTEAKPPSGDIALVIVGSFGGTHIGSSLERAANALRVQCLALDSGHAHAGAWILRAIAWRCLGRRPFQLAAFSTAVVERVSDLPTDRRILVATGHAPLTTQALKRLRATGVRTINYSTDDPWNPAHRAQWHLDALPEYDTVFTPRRANLRDFERLGCRKVRYLPFGYDDELFAAREPRQTRSGPDALFVGGADADRVDFIRRFRCVGLHPTLVGAYWNRYPEFAGLAAGLKNPDELAAMTAAAKVNLCLVRRANRDGHVMRSFEIPAVGGFVLAEDTAEHRDLFGEEGTRVLYFRSPEEAGEKTKWALDHPGERQRMARAAYELVTSGPHTYKARLTSILSDVATVAM